VSKFGFEYEAAAIVILLAVTREKKWTAALKCLLKVKPVQTSSTPYNPKDEKVSHSSAELDIDTLLLMTEAYDAIDR
jgi:hypothetical protein